uniref:NADH-ubiquinone oxidoreductase chain 2 n=1 Tax=Rhysodes sp. BMNH-844233 TaxID=1909167 RepID=A0A343A4B8_9CARA|nr:NADH dehydrogenase subunit 2 [Rhysodes sp. BMNH-844233]
MNYYYKFIFLSTLLTGTMITMTSPNWMSAWMGIEINLLSFIPLMMYKLNPQTSEASMKYFLVQSIASSLMMFMITMNMMKYNLSFDSTMMNKMMSTTLNSALMMKMGMAPLHFWLPEVANKMSWMNTLILLTWQKLAPMTLLAYSMKVTHFIVSAVILSVAIGSLWGMNQTNMQKIMAYSSINHMGWMLSTLLSNKPMWLFYLMIYSIITASITITLNNFKIFHLKQMMTFMSSNNTIKMMMTLNFLSLGGLPPLLGFLPKWMVIQSLSNMNKFMWMITLMIMMTLISLYFYIRITYLNTMMTHTKTKYLTKSKPHKPMLIISFMTSSSLIMFMILFNFL